jgi:hypothetical protein
MAERITLQTAYHGSTSPRFASAERNHGSPPSPALVNHPRMHSNHLHDIESVGPSRLKKVLLVTVRLSLTLNNVRTTKGAVAPYAIPHRRPRGNHLLGHAYLDAG